MPLKVFFSHNNEDAEWVLQIWWPMLKSTAIPGVRL